MATSTNKVLSEMAQILGEINDRYKALDFADKGHIKHLNLKIQKEKINNRKLQKEKEEWTKNKPYRELEKQVNSLGGGSSKVASTMEEAKDQVVGLWKALRSGSFKSIREQALTAKEYAKHMKEVGELISKMPGVLGKAGGTLVKMGEGLEGLAGKLGGKLGVWLAVFQVLVDTAVTIDSFVKEANKNFAAIRGPDIMTADVHKQFVTFNSALYNTKKNIEDGLQPEEIGNFTAAMGQAGMNVSNLTVNADSFREYVTEAAKAHRNLGVGLNTIAGYMEVMMQRQKMGLAETKKAFREITIDAQKTGLSVEQFWNVVQNSTVSMSFYGNFIKEASHNLKTLSDTGVSSIDDVSAATNDMFQAFFKGSTSSKMGFLLIAKNAGLTLDKVKADLKARAKEYEQMSKESGMKCLIQESYRYHDLALKAEQTSEGDITTIASNLALLANKMPSYLLYAMKGAISGQDKLNLSSILNGNQLLEMENGLQNIGLSSKKTLDLIAAAPQYVVNHLVQDTKNLKKISGDQSKTVVQIKEINEDSTPEDIDKMAETLKTQLNVGPDQAKNIAKAISGSSWIKDLIISGFNSGDLSKISSSIDTLGRARDEGTKILLRNYAHPDVSESKADTLYNNTAEKIKKETFSMEEWRKIIWEGTLYGTALKTGAVQASSNVHALAETFGTPSAENAEAARKSAEDVQHAEDAAAKWRGGGGHERYASGSSYTKGGISLVGEKGPEIVSMSSGVQVFQSSQSKMINNSSSVSTSSSMNSIINVTGFKKELSWKIANDLKDLLNTVSI